MTHSTAYVRRRCSGRLPHDGDRRAESGELCTCGRQAIVVYITPRWGPVGYCGLPGTSSRPVLPCPFCGSLTPHTSGWGDPEKCLRYRLRPGWPSLAPAFDPEVGHVA